MKFWQIIFLIFSISLFMPSNAIASDSKYLISVKATYEISEKGNTHATYNVTLKNRSSDTYAPSITLSTEGFTPTEFTAFQGGLPLKTEKGENSVKLFLKQPAVGLGASTKFVYSFNDQTLATNNKNMWKVRIPEISSLSEYESYTVNVKVPDSIAKNTYLSPTPTKTTNLKGVHDFYFDGSKLTSPLTVFLGEYESYKFEIDREVANDGFFTKTYTLLIPPETAYQTVSVSEFTPIPKNVYLDQDGNWVSEITLKPRQTTKISVKGFVKVFQKPREGEWVGPTSNHLKSDAYWESDSADIKDALKEGTSTREIFDYVVSHLTYNYDKTRSAPKRLGALEALKSPSEAICMEYTDLFIAMSRASGIPSREVNGFALDESVTRPSGIGKNILHSWPEYWDSDRAMWISVDPTWADTSGGVDYFNQMDTQHVTLLVRGISSRYPETPGVSGFDDTLLSYKLEPSEEYDEKKSLSLDILKTRNGLFNSQYTVIIKNEGSVQIAPQTLDITIGDTQESVEIHAIPPFGIVTENIHLTNGLFGLSLPSTIGATYGETSDTLSVSFLPVLLIQSLSLALIGVLLYVFVRLFKYNRGT